VGNRRVFEMPARFTQDTTIQNFPGAVYQIAGPVNVGTDVGGDGAAAGGQAVTLTIQPGTIDRRDRRHLSYLASTAARGSTRSAPPPADHLHRRRPAERHRDRFEPGPVGRDHPARPRADQRLQRRRSGRLGAVPAGDRRHDRLALRRQCAERQ
jgi:hypothetical protein